MLALLLIGSAVATAFLVALSARLESLVSTLLVAYIGYVANVGLVTLALSPLRAVTPGGLAVAELALLAAAVALWWLRGRPGPPLASAARAARVIAVDPLTALFVALIGLLLVYELVLGLTVPPDKWDSLTYHLARTAAWAEHGGLYWITNAPDVRMNAFQPLAEQENLFLFVASGGGRLFALPQFVAELAVLVAVYGSARRLGFGVRPSAGAALLLGTFSLVALESSTAENDLVAASFPAVAACLLLGESPLEAAVGGVAVAFGLGTKLTTALVLPVLVWLLWARGRRTIVAACAGAALGFVAVGMWGYVLNVAHTGHLLGVGTGALEDRASPSYPRSLANVFYFLYGGMDLSVLSSHLIRLLCLAGLAVAAACALWTLPRRGARAAARSAAGTAVPFLAPVLVIGAGGVLAFVARLWGFPIRGPGGAIGPLTSVANEDYSAFGPLGIVALVAAVALTLAAYRSGRADRRQLALASALPSFLILTSLLVNWSPYLMRFFLVPAVLAAPLLARLFRDRAATAAYLVVGALIVGLTVTNDQSEPLDSAYGHPWQLTQLTALDVNFDAWVAHALADYDELVPAHACVGAVLGPNEPTYLLYGPGLEHRVVFLSVDDALLPTLWHGLFYVVISTGPDRWAAREFAAAGWRIRPLGQLWLPASEPRATAGAGGCA